MGPFKDQMWKCGTFWVTMWSVADLDSDIPEDLIGEIDYPMMLIHGKEDRTIPYTETIRLHEAAGGKAEMWLIDGHDHMESLAHEEYRNRLNKFFREPLGAVVIRRGQEGGKSDPGR